MNAVQGSMRMTMCTLAMAACCAVAAAQMNKSNGMQNSPAAHQNSGAMSGMTPANGMSTQDKDFLRTAAKGDLFEIKAGQLASEKGQSDNVKQFGARMVKDHTQLNNDMAPYLQQVDLTAPTMLKGKEAKEYAKLQGLSGSDFDKVYVQMMLKDHQKDLSAFKQEEASTQDPNLKTTVSQGEQVIQSHLTAIQQVASTMAAS